MKELLAYQTYENRVVGLTAMGPKVKGLLATFSWGKMWRLSADMHFHNFQYHYLYGQRRDPLDDIYYIPMRNSFNGIALQQGKSLSKSSTPLQQTLVLITLHVK